MQVLLRALCFRNTKARSRTVEEKQMVRASVIINNISALPPPPDDAIAMSMKASLEGCLGDSLIVVLLDRSSGPQLFPRTAGYVRHRGRILQ